MHELLKKYELLKLNKLYKKHKSANLNPYNKKAK